MIKSSVEMMANAIGYDIGMSDDHVQADLINGFSKGLCNIKDGSKLEMQCCYIADKLDDKSLEVLTHLVEFIKLNKEK